MKVFSVIVIILLTMFFGNGVVFSQSKTNHFPDNGNVGIGIINPMEKLDVIGNVIFRNINEDYNGNPLNKVNFTYGLRHYKYSLIGGGHHLLSRSVGDGIIFAADRINGSYSAPSALNDGDFIFSLTVSGRNPSGTHTPAELLSAAVYGTPEGERIPLRYAFGGKTINVISGRVGIGTPDPKSELAVNGKITTKEIEVTLQGWPDEVFRGDYNLKPLEEVESYINKHQHLPDIPSESEVLENGVNLGEMQAKLLQKIEELTLYVIELEKKNSILKEEIINIKESLNN